MTPFHLALIAYFAVGFGYYFGYGGRSNIRTILQVVPFWPGVLLGRNTK